MRKTRKSPTRRAGLTLTAEQTATLTEWAVLTRCEDGFTYTRDMEALAKFVADMASATTRRECLNHARAHGAFR